MGVTWCHILSSLSKDLLESRPLVASLQNGAGGVGRPGAGHVGRPGSGAAEAGEGGWRRVSGTMSGWCGLQAQRGPCQVASLLFLLLGPSSVFAISFHLPVNSRKCLREEIHKDLLVTGAYEISDQSGGAGGLRTHLKVRPWARRAGTPAGVGARGEAADEDERGRGSGWRRPGGPRPPGRRRARVALAAPSPRPPSSVGRGGAPGLGNP